MTTQMVFLVGGAGTRLGARSVGLPKPLQMVAGKPFLRHLMEEARRHGVARFVLLAGHLGHLVVEEFADETDVTTLIEPWPLGTGGALRFAAPHLDDTFLMSNGDSLFRFNLLDLALTPAMPDWLGKLALRRVADADRYGVVELDGNAVRGFRDRGQGGEGLINGGVYLLRRTVIDQIGGGAVSLERDVFPGLAHAGRLAGAVYDGPFIDIGVPAALDAAQERVPAMRRRAAVLISESNAQNAAAVKHVNDAGLYVYLCAPDSVGLTELNEALAPAGAHLDGCASSLDALSGEYVDVACSVSVGSVGELYQAVTTLSG